MSVEITGPKGYEWQYRITSLVAVKNLQCDSIIVESSSGEDVQLNFSDPEAIRSVDIQAKAGKVDISSTILCKWLTHFIGQRSTITLLKKLLDDNKRVVVFVTAGRCTDNARPFIQEFCDFHPHKEVDPKVSQLLLEELHGLKLKSKSKTQLQKDRIDHINQLIVKLEENLTLLTEALRRVLIWEQTTKESMNHHLSLALTQQHQIPSLSCPGVFNQLDGAVRAARDIRGDALPEIKRILTISSARAMLGNEPHISTGQESTLLTILKEQRVLLLKGRSQCGKTNMAKYIAQVMQYEGISTKHGYDPLAAIRFLTVNNEEPRLFLLEDPFYQRRNDTSLAETFRRLVTQLVQHRFLIVTSKSDDLSSSIDPLLPHEWHDLTIRDPLFLLEFWRTRCATDELASIETTLEKGFQKHGRDSFLQPGHLMHLSRQPNLQGLTFKEIFSLARFDIKQLANNLANKNPLSREVHIGLCLGASTVQRMPIDALAFVLSNTDARPGFIEPSGTIFPPDLSTPVFPSLASISPLSQEVIHELSLIEKSGYIRTTFKGIQFSHPDYLAISHEILGMYPAFAIQNLLAMLERGLASLHEATALNSVEILAIIFQKYGNDQKSRERIFDIAKATRHSIFPTVREAVLEVMITWLPTLDTDQRRNALGFIQIVDSEYKEIFWHENMPWTRPSWDVFSMFSGQHRPRTAKEDELVNSFVNPKSRKTVSPQQAWNLVLYIEANPTISEGTVAMIELLKQPYAFLRARTVKYLIRHNTEPRLFIEPLREERNPSVMLTAIREFIFCWHNYSDESRELLKAWLNQELINASVAVVCSDLLIDFDNPSEFSETDFTKLSAEQRREVWQLWAVLFPVYLRAIASQPFEHDAGKMYRTLSKATEQLEEHDFTLVIESWISWIGKQIEIRLLDSYELPVAKLILEIEESREKRERLLATILDHRDTGYVITTIHYMLRKWNDLFDSERNLLRKVLMDTRPDSRWIRAVTITRDDVPAEIQLLLTGCEDLLSRPAGIIMKSLHPDLLSDGLHMHCGDPDLLSWYGLHHNADKPWEAILEMVAEDPFHRDFDLALDEMFYTVLNSHSKRWANSLGIWRKLCSHENSTVRRRLFDHLLRVSVINNNPQKFGFWQIFFEPIQKTIEAKSFTAEIIAKLKSISRNVDRLEDFFGKFVYHQLIKPSLTPEIKMIKILKMFQNARTDDDKRYQMTHLRILLLSSPPRIFKVLQAIRHVLKDEALPEAESMRQTIETVNQDYLNDSQKQVDSLENEKEIENWTLAYRL